MGVRNKAIALAYTLVILISPEPSAASTNSEHPLRQIHSGADGSEIAPKVVINGAMRPRLVPTATASEGTPSPRPSGDGWDQYDPTSMYDEKGLVPPRGFSAQAPNEVVDPFSGNLMLRHVDLHLPGVAGLDLTLHRVYNSKIHRNYAAVVTGDPIRVGLGLLFPHPTCVGVGWSLHMGRLVGAVNALPNAALPGPRYYEKSDGSQHPFYQYIGPGCGDETTDICLLTKQKDNPYRLTTETPWMLSTADGLTITFDHSLFDGETLVHYATEICDVHGNRIQIFYLDYTILIDGTEYERLYLPHFIDYIIDSAGRTVDFDYDLVSGDQIRLSSIAANGRVYRYFYSPQTPHSQTLLTAAQLPEGAAWQYAYEGLNSGDCADNSKRWCECTGITYPSGGTIEYTFDDHVFWVQTNPMSVRAVVQRDVGGRAVTPATWTYTYNRGAQYTEDEHTVITRPDGVQEIYTYFGVGDGPYNPIGLAWKAGVLLEKKTRDPVVGTVLQTETLDWIASPPISDEIVGDPWIGFDIGVFVPRLREHVIQRGDLTWTTEHASFYDSNNRPRCTIETGDGATRYRLQGYVTETRAQGDRLFRFLNLLNANVLSYDPFDPGVCDPSQSVSVTPALGDEVEVHSYNNLGQIVSTERNGIRTEYRYHADGTLNAEISYRSADPPNDPTDGYCTTYADYQYGVARRIGHGAPAPLCIPSVYDVHRTVDWFGSVESWTNGRGYTTGFDYDDLGRVTRITPPPISHETEILIAYDGSPGVCGTMSRVSQGVYWVETGIDGFGREASKAISGGVYVRQEYDALSRVSFRSLPSDAPDSGDGDTFAYDELGRLTSLTHADGTTIGYAYDTTAHTVTITDELGRQTVQTRRAFANPDDFQLVRIQLPGETVPLADTYTYLVGGHLTGVHYAGTQRIISYNFAKRVKHQYSPETNNLFFGYDAAGNLRCRDRGANDEHCNDSNLDDPLAQMNYELDALGRATAVTYHDPATPDATFTYDNAGNIETMTDGAGDHVFTYTATDRLESAASTINGVVYTSAYTYDERGNLKYLVYPSGRVITYDYDAGNRVTGAGDGTINFITNIEYHPAGLARRYTYGNGVTTTTGLDSRQRPDDIAASGVMNLAYGYDDVGNVTALSDSVTGYAAAFQYDDLDRLEDAAGPWGNLHYTYNAAGDRIWERLNGIYAFYQYDGFGQLASITGRLFLGFSYDDFGNTIARDGSGLHGFDYLYDKVNRIIEVTEYDNNGVGTVVARYVYDGQGRRVLAERPAGQERRVYHYDQEGNRVAESTDQGFMLTEYVVVNGRTIAELDVRQFAGDANCDRVVDYEDLHVLQACFAGSGNGIPVEPTGCEGADFDGDLDIDCHDAAIMQESLDLESCAFGDFDCDRDIDYDDVRVFSAAAAGPLTESPCVAFDADADGNLDLLDYAALQRAFTLEPPPNKFWIVDADGFWHEPANWSDNEVPDSDDVVSIDRAAGDYTITISEGEQSCFSVTSEERLTIAGGTLTVEDTVQVNNEFKLGAGTIANGTIRPGSSGEGLIPSTSVERGTLDGVNLQANMLMQRNDHVNIAGGMTLDGVITMATPTGLCQLQFLGAGALDGAGEIVFTPGMNGTQGLWSADDPWNIGSDMTIRGGGGIVGGKGFVNLGTIRAESAGEEIRINQGGNEGTLEASGGGTLSIQGDSFGGTPWRNNGTVQATNGGTLSFVINWRNDGVIALTDSTVNFGGTFTRGDIGNLQRSGGTVNINGTLDNTASTLALDSTTGSWTLSNGGRILGGTVVATDGAVLIIGDDSVSPVLDGVTVNADLQVADTSVKFVNGVVLDGTAALQNGTLYFEPAEILNGTGEVVFDGGRVLPRIGSSTLTIGAGMTIRTGAGSGSVGGYYPGGTIINQGAISAETADQTIYVECDGFTNEGVFTTVNGGRFAVGVRSPAMWTNTGTISVGKGSSFTVDLFSGGFEQTSTGAISVEIGGFSDAERGAVLLGNVAAGTLAVALDGTLNITLVDGFVPGVGAVIEAVYYSPGSRSGEFATINGLDIGNGTAFQPTYTDTALLLEVVVP